MSETNNEDRLSKTTSFLDTNRIINDYIFNINDPQVRIVSDEECDNWKENLEDYDRKVYKYVISQMEKLEGDVNNDKRFDLIVTYRGDNCWQGIGASNYLSNFFFLVSENDSLQVDENLTNIFKQTFIDTLTKYFPNNYLTKPEKASFVNDVNFLEIKDDNIKGTFAIMQCGASPCLSGDFSYNINAKSITFANLK